LWKVLTCLSRTSGEKIRKGIPIEGAFSNAKQTRMGVPRSMLFIDYIVEENGRYIASRLAKC
jgi:hypothetical protein